MPIYRRVPKFGFKNPNRVAYRGINLDTLQTLVDSNKIEAITPEVLIENGLARKNDLIKIMGRGKLKSKLEINAHAFTKTAQEAIEAAGGVANMI